MVTLSRDQPPRLICVRCGKPRPFKPEPPPYQRFMRNLRRGALLAPLLLLPLVVAILSPWFDQQPNQPSQRSRLNRVTTGRVPHRLEPDRAPLERRR
jgi:hypothetical protein